MSYSITLQPALIVDLDSIAIEHVQDSFDRQRIVARIKDLPRSVVLWDGPEEYAAAGDWTNESALNRAIEVLSLSAVPFE